MSLILYSTAPDFSFIDKLILLFSLLISIAITYGFYQNYQKVISYVENNIPDFVYDQGNLTAMQEEPMIQEQEEGMIIIDTNITADTQEAKEHIEKLKKYQTQIY